MEVRYISVGLFPYPVAAYVDYFKKEYPQSRYFCIHRSVSPGKRKLWTLTHIPTGYAMGSKFRTRSEAVACLKRVLNMQRAFANTGEDFSGDMRGASWWINESKELYASIVRNSGGNW